MSIDLAQFHDAFFSESYEALDSMEAALLKLTDGDTDPELINTIFRVAHSIKGGSATFGFSDIAAFTHTLETLLDEIRAGKRTASRDIVDALLQSIDVIRDMLIATQEKRPVTKDKAAELHTYLEQILASPVAQNGVDVNHASKPLPHYQIESAASGPTERNTGHDGWRIRFIPGPDLIRNGNDPLRMLRELSRFGKLSVRVDASRISTLASIDPEVCSLSWTIELGTSATRDEVLSVFEWAIGECELTVEPIAAVALPAESSERKAEPVTTPTYLVVGGERTDPTAIEEKPGEQGQPSKGPKHSGGRAGVGEGNSIRISIEKIDELLNAVGELVITQSVLNQLAAPIDGRQAEELRSALAQLERHMRSLQESVMRVRMLPISFVFNRFPRMVRDLGQRLGKRIELRMSGDQTELDKTVLEKITDPLVHLVRNAVDHGIETPSERSTVGKSAVGTITLHAYHKGGNVIVEVTDDGRGLDRQRILKKARERGLVTADEELSEEKIFNLIFAPGFSTAEVVSDLSGRGVGMDVVRRNINEIGGHVQVLSSQGKGSTVRIRLPLTLAILDGQLARVGSEIYVVPILSIVETIQVRRNDTSTMANQVELLRLRDEYVPIVRLYSLFGVEPERTDLVDGLLMIVEADGKRIGLYVDELLSQQQVVIKSLETNFRQVAGMSGATMLGDGRVALILDIPGIIALLQEPRANATEVRAA